MIRTKNNTSVRGFTIVELLIVIVVIGILAVVTVVAYNGIQSRARSANAQSALSQINKRLAAYMVEYSAYPDQSTFSNLFPNTTTSYQYTGTASSYCVTATNGTTDYKADSTATQPAAGACPGHGTSGLPAITNNSYNPSIESATTGYTVPTYGTGGVGNFSRDATQGYVGTASLKMTWTTSATGANAGLITPAITVTAGNTYTYSVYLKPSKSVSVYPAVRYYTLPGGSGTSSDSTASTVVIPAGSWTRVSNTVTIPAGNQSAGFRLGLNTLFAAGDTVNADANMMTDGASLYTYADGNSSGWIWTGAADTTTSYGPQL
jgi:prepilin-type N-terminal cleavage/methylation domain-containing protein